MREEIDRRKPELNEQALEQISGGAHDPAIQSKRICSECPVIFAHRGQCDGGRTELLNYLRRNGVDSVTEYKQCPFYRP